MNLSEINLRDPFILLDDGKYYLYGTRGYEAWGECTGLDVYVSDDLVEWSEPIECFKRFEGFWATKNFWAPEVHKYKGAYYMLASFKGESRSRGTQILRADSPIGPFLPHSDGPITPCEWECLDGTLYVEEGIPYMIFCHEWTQVVDGEMYAVRLADDLSAPVGEPRLLFKASELPCGSNKRHKGYITDGPFLYRMGNGRLIMIWSSFNDKGYIEAVAFSDSGSINGNWIQCDMPMSDENGGHGMLFRDKAGSLCFTMHSPNGPSGAERVKLLKVCETDVAPYLS